MSKDKNKMKEALESHFTELLGKINQRFEESAGQLQGLNNWMQQNLQGLSNKFSELRTHYLVQSLKTTALVELCVQKNLITQEEYDQKTEEIAKRQNEAQNKQG